MHTYIQTRAQLTSPVPLLFFFAYLVTYLRVIYRSLLPPAHPPCRTSPRRGLGFRVIDRSVCSLARSLPPSLPPSLHTHTSLSPWGKDRSQDPVSIDMCSLVTARQSLRHRRGRHVVQVGARAREDSLALSGLVGRHADIHGTAGLRPALAPAGWSGNRGEHWWTAATPLPVSEYIRARCTGTYTHARTSGAKMGRKSRHPQ